MSRARVYPPADTDVQWYGGTVRMGGVSKLVLHSTEGGSWPDYGGGSYCPTLTYDRRQPAGRRWRQHTYLDESARALRDPDGTEVQENRDDVVQVEIVGTCDWQLARQHGLLLVTELDDEGLADLGHLARFLADEWGLPLRAPDLWLPYRHPSGSTTGGSYGASRARMTGPQFDQFRGVLGHQHVSGNDHGDPGDLDVATVLRHAQGDDMPSWNDSVPLMEDNTFGDATRASIRTEGAVDRLAAQFAEFRDGERDRDADERAALQEVHDLLLEAQAKLLAAGEDDLTGTRFAGGMDRLAALIKGRT